NEKVRYQAHRGIKEQVQIAIDLFGDKRAEMDRLLSLFADLSTRRAELMATAYFAWNDLLLEGTEPAEAEIISEFYAWHESKRSKFSEAKIREAIDWLKANDLVPM